MSLGFIPVAVHFDLFTILTRAGRPITPEEVAEISNAEIRERAKGEPELGMPVLFSLGCLLTSSRCQVSWFV